MTDELEIYPSSNGCWYTDAVCVCIECANSKNNCVCEGKTPVLFCHFSEYQKVHSIYETFEQKKKHFVNIYNDLLEKELLNM